MNEQIIGSIYTLAGGVVLYSVKEILGILQILTYNVKKSI